MPRKRRHQGEAVVTENLERSFASTRSVLANVDKGDLDKSTPCASWQVRDLLNHIIGGAHWFGQTAETGQSASLPDRDWTEGDMVASFDEGAKRTVAAFGAPGAQERTMKLPFGDFPGAAYMMLATTDSFIHGWDLAKATGQSTDLDPELAAQLMQVAPTMIPDQFRGPEPLPFGPVLEAPAGASNADLLAAFFGRRC